MLVDLCNSAGREFHKDERSIARGLHLNPGAFITKEELPGKAPEAKLWKRELVVVSRSSVRKSEMHGGSFSVEVKFRKRDQNASMWKRGCVLAKRSGGAL